MFFVLTMFYFWKTGFLFFWSCWFVLKCVFVFWVCFGLHIDVLDGSMRFSVIFCAWNCFEPIWIFQNKKRYRTDPKWFHPLIPIPGVSKGLLPGANKLEKSKCLMIFYDFYEKQKGALPGGAFKGVPKKKKTPFSPRGSKKKKSNNDDKHGHGQEKRRLSTLCWGKKYITLIYICMNIYIYIYIL